MLLLPPEASTRTTVSTASVGLLTIDTRSAAVTACNDAFAELVGCPPHDVQGCLITDFVDADVRPVAASVIEGVRAGFISSVDGSVDLVRPGGLVGIDCWILALGAVRPHDAALAGVVPVDGFALPEIEPSEMGDGFGPPHLDQNRIVLAMLDDDWRIVEVAPGSAGQLGLPAPNAVTGTPRLRDLVHPADASTLDARYSRRASMEGPDTLRLRLRSAHEQWVSARVTLSPLHGAARTFGLVVSLTQMEEPAADSERVARLEGQIDRIRQVVQTTDGANGLVDLRALTVRQREIVARLLDGHRVDAIARDLYVSPSTVRNHLSAIFEKLGVASQSELVELLRGDADGARPNRKPGRD